VGNLPDSGNEIVFDDRGDGNFQLHSIDVLKVSGGTEWALVLSMYSELTPFSRFNYSATTALPSPTATDSPSNGELLQVSFLILFFAVAMNSLYGFRLLL
jgi:hypothetical protein